MGRCVVLLLLVLRGHQHAAARAIAVHGDALQVEVPGRAVDIAHQFRGHGTGQVDGAADAVGGELLHGGLQADAVVPVDVRCRALVVRALLHVGLAGGLHPVRDAWVVHGELLPLVAHGIGEGDLLLRGVGHQLAATRVAQHVHGLDAAAGAREQAEGAGGCHGADADVASAVLHHAGMQLGQFGFQHGGELSWCAPRRGRSRQNVPRSMAMSMLLLNSASHLVRMMCSETASTAASLS
jgi:hypothetical protein